MRLSPAICEELTPADSHEKSITAVAPSPVRLMVTMALVSKLDCGLQETLELRAQL